MSRDIPNFVETSTNFAAVDTQGDYFVFTTSQRSSVDSALDDVANMVSAEFKLAVAETDHAEGLSGLDTKSQVRNTRCISEIVQSPF